VDDRFKETRTNFQPVVKRYMFSSVFWKKPVNISLLIDNLKLLLGECRVLKTSIVLDK
jgi:hypothetical protein